MATQSRPLQRGSHPVAGLSLRVDIPERLLLGTVGFVVVIVAWQAVVDLGLVNPLLVSSPTAVLEAAIADAQSGVIWPQIGTSLAEWTGGFVLALVLGIPFGFIVGLFRRLELLLDPLLSALYATPMVALAPMIILVFGVDLPAKIFTVFVFAFLPTVINTITGAKSAEQRHLEIARSFGASRSLVLRSVTIPSSVPYILTGVRIAAGHALVGMVVAEFLAANAGIGFYISFNGTLLHSDRVMLGVVLIGIFGVFVGEIVRRLEHHFDNWRPAIH